MLEYVFQHMQISHFGNAHIVDYWRFIIILHSAVPELGHIDMGPICQSICLSVYPYSRILPLWITGFSSYLIP